MFWTTIVTHEITFYFTFIFPLSSLLSWILLPSEWRKNRRKRLLVIFTGPFGTLYLLSKCFLPLPASLPSKPLTPPAIQRRVLLWLILVSWAALLATGMVILLHPGWSRLYYAMIKAHSAIGYASLAVFLLYVVLHLRDYALGAGAWIGFLGLLLLFGIMYTLNEMTGLSPTSPFLLSIPLLPAIYFCFRKVEALARRRDEVTNPAVLKAGSALLYMLALSYYTGVYVEKHASPILSNNMALYILYMHGAAILLVAPFLVGTINHHLSRRFGRSLLPKYRLWISAYAVGFLLVFPYSYKKWSGNSTEWRPVKTTYVTDKSLGGSSSAMTVPSHYVWTLEDDTVCKTDGCHPSLVSQFENSTHRYSANNVIFKKVVELLAADKGRESVRSCALCHDPVGALLPDGEGQASPERWAQSRGVTCKVCHSMIEVDARRGNGIFRLRTEIPYPVDLTSPDWRTTWAGFIRWDLRLHFKNYSFPPFYQTAEYCISCHRVTAPVDGKEVMIHDVLESWKESPYSQQGVRCRACHMDEFMRDERGILFPDHRFPGFNQALALKVSDPAMDGEKLAEFERFTESWIQGGVRGATIKKMHFRKPILGLTLRATGEVRPGGNLELTATTVNARVGHDFPVGFKDLNEIWLEVEAVDGAGNVIHHSGKLNPDKTLTPDGHILGAAMVHKKGEPIHLHKTMPTPRRSLPPLGEGVDQYRIDLPDGVVSPISVRARWNYRRIRQEYVEWFYEGDVTFPVTEIVSATLTVPSQTDAISPPPAH